MITLTESLNCDSCGVKVLNNLSSNDIKEIGKVFCSSYCESKSNKEEKIVPFNKNETGTSLYNRFLRNPDYMIKQGYNFKIVEMTPETYLSKVAQMQETSLSEQYNEVNMECVKHYYSMMKSGNKFPILTLDYWENSQDGRHRAIAAELLGVNVPVLIIWKTEIC